MLGLLAWMERRSAALLAGSVFVGLISQDLAAVCKPALGPAVFVLLAATIMRLEWRQVLFRLRSPWRPLIIVAALLIGAPLAMDAVTRLLGVPEFLRGPLVLLASSSPLISVPAFALLLGLDGPLGLVVMVGASVLQPFVQPPVALSLVGVKLDIGLAALMTRLALFIGGACAVALVLRAAAGAERIRRHGPALGGVAVVMLVIFAIGVMDGLRAQFLAEPGRVLACVAAVFAANLGLQAAGALVFWAAGPAWGFSGREGLTAALAIGARNLATLVAALGPAAGPDLYLMLAVNQFPMYLIPSLCGPVYRRLLKIRD